MKREQDDPPILVPKMKFKPKVPPRKQSKAVATKVEPSETKGDLIDKELLSKLNNAKSEDAFGRRPKKERKSAPMEVAFGHGRTSSIRSFGNPTSSATGSKNGDISVPIRKEYVEPWDYSHTYYPITLPLRRPYSGDPEILDKEEFGEDALNEDNKPIVPPAEELGLMETTTEPQMFLFQFPTVLPFAKSHPAAAESQGSGIRMDTPNASIKGSNNQLDAAAVNGRRTRQADAENKSKNTCSLKDLPSGYMGKMLVYKNGKIKMKIGDTLFDVSPGQNCAFAQDVAVINVKEKHCCVVGNPTMRAVVTPDIDALLDSIEKL